MWAGLSNWRLMAIGLVVGLAGALSFIALGLPLPWFLGALTASMALAIVGIRFDGPKPIQTPVRIVLGVAVGTAFTPALLERAPGMGLSLLLMVPWVLAIMAGVSWVLRRLAGLDPMTALFASVPGGLTDMVTMAEDAGAKVRTVTLIQLTRIVLIVFLVPAWLVWHDGFDVAATVSGGRVGLRDSPPLDLLLLVVQGYLGWRLASAIGLAGPAIVGPMLFSAVMHVSGLTAGQVPREAMIISQVALGILLGNQFRGLTLQEFRATVTWGLGIAVVMVVATVVLTELAGRALGLPYAPALLAYAPGGQAELNLLAYAIGIDVAFVALHHLCRLAVCLLGVQVWYRRVRG